MSAFLLLALLGVSGPCDIPEPLGPPDPADAAPYIEVAKEERAAGALDTALEWYEWPDLWRQIMENGMRQDFSWRRAVGEYERLYASLLTA